jgi:hypothetical protein
MNENECEDLISDQANQQTSMEMKGRMKHRYTVYQVRSRVRLIFLKSVMNYYL